jgi:hypothetical protein
MCFFPWTAPKTSTFQTCIPTAKNVLLFIASIPWHRPWQSTSMVNGHHFAGTITSAISSDLACENQEILCIYE